MKCGLPIAPPVDGVLDCALDSAESPLHRDHQYPPRFRRCVDHFARVRSGGSHRLLHQRVRAGVERLYGKFAMQMIRREDTDRVGPFAREHFVEIGIDFRATGVVRPSGPRDALGLVRGAAL